MGAACHGAVEASQDSCHMSKVLSPLPLVPEPSATTTAWVVSPCHCCHVYLLLALSYGQQAHWVSHYAMLCQRHQLPLSQQLEQWRQQQLSGSPRGHVCYLLASQIWPAD